RTVAVKRVLSKYRSLRRFTVEGGRSSGPRRRIQELISESSPLASTTSWDRAACQGAGACSDRRCGVRAPRGSRNCPAVGEGPYYVSVEPVGNGEWDDAEKTPHQSREP